MIGRALLDGFLVLRQHVIAAVSINTDIDYLFIYDGGDGLLLRVKAVMLHYEDDIVDHGKNGEGQLYRINVDIFAPDGFECQLQEREKPSSEIQQNVCDAPSDCRLTLPVPIHLW